MVMNKLSCQAEKIWIQMMMKTTAEMNLNSIKLTPRLPRYMTRSDCSDIDVLEVLEIVFMTSAWSF